MELAHDHAVTTIIVAALFGVLPSVGVLLAYGWAFLRTTHPIPGWAVLCALATGGLFAASVVLNVGQWLTRRRERGRTVQAVAQGYPSSLNWNMGARMGPPDVPLMMVWGDFHITNLTPHNVAVPRAILLASYKRWYVVPWRKRFEGPGIYNPIAGGRAMRERLHWNIEPPILRKGAALRARLGLIDHLGRVNWGEWLNWKYLG